MSTQIDTSTDGGVGSPGPYGDMTATPAGNLIAVAPSDATLNVMYFGSTGPMLATSLSPYSSWSKQIIGADTQRNSQSLTGHPSDDGIDMIVSSPGSGPYYFGYIRSGNSWSTNSNGQTGDIVQVTSDGATTAMWMAKDTQGRFWYIEIDGVNNPYHMGCAYYSAGWHMDATFDNVSTAEQNRLGVAGAIIGNYLVIVYDSGSGHLSYRRQDVSGASLPGWSAAAQVGSISDVTTSSTLSLRASGDGTLGMLAYKGGNGISALSYNPSTDTWGTATVLSNAANDKHCSLISGASATVYAVWAQYAAANSYALVGNVYSGGSWNGSPSTLEASGNNIAWPTGAYLSSGTKLALVWTQGTASPWSVEFDAVAAPAPSGGADGGTLVSNSGMVVTAQIQAPAAMVSNSSLSQLYVVLRASCKLQSDSLLLNAESIPVATRSVVAFGVDCTVIAYPF
ncbi:MAG: hypothetical protein KGL39_45750 [Patescibacteria group bacterium]|nr:hypothetical protein [Patescibacteria group bacterium]